MSLLWDKILRPIAFRMDAERAHEMGLRALELGLAAPFYRTLGSQPIERFGLTFANPIGMAAGFDKNGLVVEQLASLGFGFVEVGTVTARPQPGNPIPRLFRVPESGALINRLGFNNDGAAVVAKRLKSVKRKCVVGVNIGRNKDVTNENAVENYVEAFRRLQPVADYVAINVSSPNTPDLRDLQGSHHLAELISALQSVNDELGTKPLLLKIAPDLGEADIEQIVGTCLSHNVAGIIAANTTIRREGLVPAASAAIEGGLSGRPLKSISDRMVSVVHRSSAGRLPVIGVGGISNPEDVFDKIAAGASLVQVYTGFVYAGPGFASELAEGLAKILKQKGFSTLEEAVGRAPVV